MAEGITCYERDEELCEDQMCARTGCRLRNERLSTAVAQRPLKQPSTPLPWRFSPWHVEEGSPAVRAPAGYIVCTTASDADAEYIAEACNAYASQPAPDPFNRKQVEAICRAVCDVEGLDPDDTTWTGDDPPWTRYADAVANALASQPSPAATVETARSDGKTIGEFYGDPFASPDRLHPADLGLCDRVKCACACREALAKEVERLTRARSAAAVAAIDRRDSHIYGVLEMEERAHEGSSAGNAGVTKAAIAPNSQSLKAAKEPALADGCCSAIQPCSHQRSAPSSICDTCRAALPQAPVTYCTASGPEYCLAKGACCPSCPLPRPHLARGE